VTILVNNAGIASGKSILEKNEQMIRKTFEVNTLAHLFTIREFLPDMLRLNKGHVVTIASIAGTVAVPGMSDYSASKFGAFAIDECLRLEMKKGGHNIQTTCICPYYINTGMFEGVPSTWYSPILDQHWVVSRIINAVRQNEPVVLMPWHTNLYFIGRGLFPTWLGDFIFKVCGAFEHMDNFIGRHAK
jgi:short-subunit dehydrogenase